MYYRHDYMDLIKTFKGKNIIKIITGIRRCGKSTILRQLEQEFNSENANVIFITLEDYKFNKLKNIDEFYKYIEDNIDENKKNYLLVDEVQLVNNFEQVINSFHASNKVDIYITGSNAFMLSNELSTLMSGRYVEIKVYPFSYRELYTYNKSTLEDYFLNGGLPALFTVLDDPTSFNMYLEGIIASIITKDILNYNKNINQIQLDNVINYYLDNIGNIENAKKVADYISSNSSSISVRDVQQITSSLLNSFLFYECKRYDLKGKRLLTHSPKYYICDPIFRKKIYSEIRDIGRVIENIVFMELTRRYPEVYIGKIGDYEVDFIAKNKENITYYQVALSIMEEKTLEREIRPFILIKDNFPKVLVTNDTINLSLPDGVKHLKLIDFLMETSN